MKRAYERYYDKHFRKDSDATEKKNWLIHYVAISKYNRQISGRIRANNLTKDEAKSAARRWFKSMKRSSKFKKLDYILNEN